MLLSAYARRAVGPAAIWLCVLATSSSAASGPANLPTTTPVRFVIVGDTGRGNPGQYAVALAMERVCAELGCQFAVAVGDNIYEYGPRSVVDPQFQTKFERPYARLAFPFFMVLGNHDQSGLIPGSGVHPEWGDFEVQYTRRSTKWMMPQRYYRFGVPFASPTDFKAQVAQPIIDFFALDTNHLAPQNMPAHEWYKPGYAYDLTQRQWLREGLAASRASWKIVVGHHPYRNNGKHGDAGDYLGLGLAKGRALQEMYEQEVCGKADLLLAGHDHSMQWLMSEPRCGARPQFVISGAGSIAYPYKPERTAGAFFQAFGTLGFFWATATVDSLTLVAFVVDEHGVPTRAYERTLRK
ncbi:MAG TPA: metallophosphoesterase [Polyangiales bacterium]|nr:metallophosphoesterase [Polyangiales bacterium]